MMQTALLPLMRTRYNTARRSRPFRFFLVFLLTALLLPTGSFAYADESANTPQPASEATPLSGDRTADYSEAYQVIQTTPCEIPNSSLGDNAEATELLPILMNNWLLEIARGGLEDAGIDAFELTSALIENSYVPAVNGTVDNPAGISGKADFLITSQSYPGFSIERKMSIMPTPVSSPVTSPRSFAVSGGEEGSDYTYLEDVAGVSYRELRVLTSTPLVISMEPGVAKNESDVIVISSEATADITLDSVNSDLSSRVAPAVVVEPGGSAIVRFAGVVALSGGFAHAGIEASFGASATLDMAASASVSAQGGVGGAGIGGAFGKACGDLTFKNVTEQSSTDAVTLSARGGERILYFPYNGQNESFGGAGIGGGACITDSGNPTPRIGEDETGLITIEAGLISAYGAARGAGIGGGAYNAPRVHILGGSFPEVIGGNYGTGIGGGAAASGGTIVIEGSSVFTNIEGGRHAAGIGSSTFADTAQYAGSNNGGNIAIQGNATIKLAQGGAAAAGIGGGLSCYAGDITIAGSATVLARGGEDKINRVGGAGIGSGSNGIIAWFERGLSSVKISDSARVTAVGAVGGACIGSGNRGGSVNVTITGQASVRADQMYEGSFAGAGIGSGVLAEFYNAASSKPIIAIGDQAHVVAAGGSSSAAIGGGAGCTAGTVLIEGNPTIEATGGLNSAAIGGGDVVNSGSSLQHGNSGTISLSGGIYNLVAGTDAAAIGSGRYAQTQTITIANSTMFLSSAGTNFQRVGAAYIGNGGVSSGSSNAPAVEEQFIRVSNSLIKVTDNSTADPSSIRSRALTSAPTLSLFGGATYAGDILIESGTLAGTISPDATVLSTSKKGGIVIMGGTFNVAGGNGMTSVDSVNAQGKPVFLNILQLQDATSALPLTGGSIGNDLYDFTGAITDEEGRLRLFLPATQAEESVRIATSEDLQYSNSWLRENGQTYEKTLYKETSLLPLPPSPESSAQPTTGAAQALVKTGDSSLPLTVTLSLTTLALLTACVARRCSHPRR